MTSATSKYAHLYLGNVEADPVPVFRDLAPDGVRLPDGSVIAWPAAAVFAVCFAEGGRAPETFGFEFFDNDGWPVGFPASGRYRFTPNAQRTLQRFDFGWSRWSQRDLELCSEDGGEYLVRLGAQVSIARLVSEAISP